MMRGNDNDKYLLLELSKGNEKSFNILFERYRNQLFTYLFKISKSRETAEEIVLDVFLKLWHGREIVAEIENLEAFLFRVAHNKAIDFFRAARRDSMRKEELWKMMQERLNDETEDLELSSANSDYAINEAVNLLSPQRRKVFYLRGKGMSYKEIATELDLSSNTVRNHLAASIQFIREILNKNDKLLFLVFMVFTEKK